jgi:hypothetical protein
MLYQLCGLQVFARGRYTFAGTARRRRDVPQVETMRNLYRRLSSVGLTRAFVRKTALPSWWDDEIALNPAGYAQALLLLSRHLGLELRSLQEDSVSIRLKNFGVCKYKMRADVTEDELALARVLATGAAQFATEAMPMPSRLLPIRAGEIRQQILDRGVPWVGLDTLIEYCWSIGIPVLHLDHFPTNTRRPDGFAARVQGRPAIVLCRKTRFSAWLLFILAHELGHIALCHIPDGGTLLDEHVDQASQDDEEKQANAFALELLTGKANCRFFPCGRWPNAHELAQDACQIGRQQMIDPGHIVLNYAHAMGNSFFAVGNAALKLLEPHADAVGLVRAKMAKYLDWSRLPEDSSEFLMRVTRQG